MKVYVINAYKDRREKYDDRYNIFPAIWYENITDDILEKYHFRYNAKKNYRRKVVACAESHQNMLKHIISNDLKEVVIIEDDAVINDFSRLEELKDINDFTYIGGDITSLTLNKSNEFRRTKKEKIRESLKKGLNEIDISNWRIAHACGYYIPNKEVAEKILKLIPVYEKCRAIDKEYMMLQEKKIIKDFIYPAIVTLNIGDAKKGFNYSTYKLHSDQFYY